MGISLPIGSHLDDSQARRTAQRAEDYFSNAGRRAGDEFSNRLNQGLNRVDTGRARQQAEQLQRAYDRAADAAGKLRAEEAKLEEVNSRSTSTNAQKIAQSERVERARRSEARATRDAVNALRDMENESRTASAAADSLAISSGGLVSSLGTSLTGAADAAKSSLGGMVPDELASSLAQLAVDVGMFAAKATAMVGAVGMAGGAAAELSGVIGTLPGVIAGSVAAFGSLKLATLGFSDAIGDVKDAKKFAKDLADLSPNAQQAALAIQAMMPAFDGLKNATQDALFAGMGQEFNRLADSYLPALQQMTTTIAGSFGQMFKGVTDQLMTPETQTAVRSAMANIGQAFQNLVPAIGPVTKAIADLANVSAGFLPGFATSIANAATQFSTFLSSAAQSGELQKWIRDGVDAFKSFGDILPAVKDLFMDFKANGKTAMEDIVWVTKKVVEALGWIGEKYDSLSRGVKTMANFAVSQFNSLGSAVSNALEPLRQLIELNNKFNPLSRITGRTIDQIPRFKPFDLPAPDVGLFDPWGSNRGMQGRAVAEPGWFAPGSPGSPVPAGVGAVAGVPSGVPAYPNSPYAVPVVPDKDGKAKKLPTVPMSNGDPMSLLQGFPVTASLYSAAGAVLDQQQKVAQARSDLATLEKSGTATQSEVVAKKNELARAEREQHEAELRLVEAKQQATNKSLKSMQDTHSAMSTLGAGLDQDLGISKGLPGMADNLVRFLAGIATAPLQGALQRQIDADPRKGGFGLMGILGAQGVFGDQYTGLPDQTQGNYLGSRGASGGYAGGYASDAMLLGNVPAGRYSQTGNADLTKGLGDCSSAVEDLVNLMDGRPTGGRSMSTGNAADWLTAHGFLPGMGGPGDFRVGFNGGHMQATLPGGTPFNWGSDSAAARRGIGGTGADDPAFTSHFYRPSGAMVTGAQDATGALNGLAGAANAATQALSGGPSGPSLSHVQTFGPALPAGPALGSAASSVPSAGPILRVPALGSAAGSATGPSASLLPPLTNPDTSGLSLPGGPLSDGTRSMPPPPGLPPAGVPSGGPLSTGMPNGLPTAPLGTVGPAGSPFAGAQNPTQIGAVVPEASGMGKGGIGMSGGGLMEAAMQAGGLALDAMAPGAGQAAQTGMKLINRTIQYGGQAAGIGVQGLMDTFLPMGGSQLAQSNWATRIIGGLAGALPAIPNMAGKKAPEQAQGGQGQGGAGNTTTVNHNTTINAEGRDNGGLARDWEYNTTQAAMTPAVGP